VTVAAPRVSEKLIRLIAATKGNPGHDYPEDWEHENGMYESICIKQECKQHFIGGKYRFICKACSAKLPGQAVGQGLQ
jgi:hypothetical protein